MKISDKGLNLIKNAEGCSLISYKCPAGVWTIGYGHTKEVKEGMKITSHEAIEFLKEDCKNVECYLSGLGLDLNQNQFDALVSFVYNVGVGNFSRSTLLNKIRVGASVDEIKAEFRRWIYASGKVQRGLVNRREREIDLFFQK